MAYLACDHFHHGVFSTYAFPISIVVPILYLLLRGPVACGLWLFDLLILTYRT